MNGSPPSDLDVGVALRVAEQDALVEDVGVRTALLDGGDALRVLLEQQHVRLRCDLLHRERRGRVALGRHRLAVQVVDGLDGVVVLLDHDRVAGLVVRAGEGDLLRALGRDRVGREDGVDGVVLEQRLAGVHRGDRQLGQRLHVGLAGDVVREHLREARVEAGQLAGVEVLDGEQRAGVGAADLQVALSLDLLGPGVGVDVARVGHRGGGDDLVVAAAGLGAGAVDRRGCAGAAARGEGGEGDGGEADGRGAASASLRGQGHDGSFLGWVVSDGRCVSASGSWTGSHGRGRWRGW